MMNELINYAKRKRKQCLVCKIDFEKANDSVDWPFLNYMLQRLGFGVKWRSWIRTCISGTTSVLVNGSPMEEFSLQRGLKQGDLLAPFLVLVVAEGLSSLVSKAGSERLFKGFAFGVEEVVISHLQ